MSTTTIRINQKTGRSTGNVIAQDHIAVAYAASITIVNNPNTEESTRKIGTLTGALTVIADTTNPLIGDRLILAYVADTSARTITYSTGFSTGTSTDTIAASTSGVSTFRYNGTTWDKITSAAPTSAGASSTVTRSSPAYAATLALTPAAGDNRYTVAQLTGAMTINITTTNMLVGDKTEFVFGADGTNRIVTFGTGMKTSGTMTVVASKFGGISFMYDGTELVAQGREITA